MKNIENQPNELLQSISGITAATPNLSRETAQDALKIVVDAINSSVSGLIITELNGIIRFGNPSFCKIFGYSIEDIIGKNAADLFSAKEVRKFSDELQ